MKYIEGDITNTNQKPILSVIIPIYNSSQYLPECLDSVIASISGRKAKIEMILIDDGSTDGCTDICDSYVRNHSFIHCVHQENAGVSSARNKGLGLAQGNYIAWIDSDDTVTTDWFTQIYNAIVQNAPDVIVFDSLRLKGKRRIPEQYGRPGGAVAKQTMLDDIARDIRMLSGLPNRVIKASCYSAAKRQPAEQSWGHFRYRSHKSSQSRYFRTTGPGRRGGEGVGHCL